VLIPTYEPHRTNVTDKTARDSVSPQVRRTIHDLIAVGAVDQSGLLVHSNCGLLVQARAALLARAYNDPSAEEFLFLDADVSVGAGTIQAMRELNLMSVGCGYTGRSHELRDTVLGVAAEPRELIELEGRRLLKMRWLAFGCMLLRREAIDRLYSSCEHHKTAVGDYDAISPWTPIVREVDGVPRLLEDGYSCCERLREVSVPTWCFLDAIVSHAGHPCFAGALYPIA